MKKTSAKKIQPQRAQSKQRLRKRIRSSKFDELVKSCNSMEFVIPGESRNPVISIPPSAGWTPAFAGVTLQATFYDIINIQSFPFPDPPI
jgi:hypothetical protein